MHKQHHTPHKSRSSLRLLVIFCVVVILAILASLGYRLFNLINQSKFDGTHTFLVSFVYKNDLDIVSIDPGEKSFSHLQVRGGKDIREEKKDVSVLTDAAVTLSKPFSLQNISDYFLKAAWHQDGITAKLNNYDLYRLSFLTKHIAPTAIQSESIHVPFDESASSSLLQQLFIDNAIDQENKTVAIVNGTGTAGLGSRLEQALIIMGVNVISVKNADNVESTSRISYFGEKSYTVKRLQSLLGMPLGESPTQNISDIIILIGKDKSQTLDF